MKIHPQSDVHLEFGVPFEAVVASNVVVCAGDIGTLTDKTRKDQLKRYFNGLKESTDNIIWVLGNHEFYNSVYEDTLENAKKLADEEDVFLLDIELGTQDLVIDGVSFWGTTFWTDLNQHDWFAHRVVQEGLNDFHCITHRDSPRKFTAHESYEINQKSREMINWDADVIITHHCPIDIEHPRFPKSDISYAFVNTGLEDKIHDSNVKLWIYGHNHWSANHNLSGTQVVSNQRGYHQIGHRGSEWTESTNYDPRLILEI